jgi:hypothetical protein
MTPEAQGKVGPPPPPVPGCNAALPYVCHSDKPNELDAAARKEKHQQCIAGCPLAYCLKVCAHSAHNCSSVCYGQIPPSTDTPCQSQCAEAINKANDWQSVDVDEIAEKYKHQVLEITKKARLDAAKRAAEKAKLLLLKNPKAPSQLEAFNDEKCHTRWLVNHTCPALHGCLKLGTTCRASAALHDTEFEKVNDPTAGKDTVYSVKMTNRISGYRKANFPTSTYNKVLANLLKVDVSNIESTVSDASVSRRRLLALDDAGVVVVSDVSVQDNGVAAQAAVQSTMKSLKAHPSNFKDALMKSGVKCDVVVESVVVKAVTHSAAAAAAQGKTGRATDAAAEDDDVIPSTLPGIRFEVAPWSSVLEQFDKNGDQALSLDEVKAAFEKQAVAFFNAVDKDKDERVSRAEYEAYGQEMQSSEA